MSNDESSEHGNVCDRISKEKALELLDYLQGRLHFSIMDQMKLNAQIWNKSRGN